MIGKFSRSGNFLCVTYDRFSFPDGFTVKNATLDYHLNQLCTLVLLAFLVHMENEPKTVTALSPADKDVLKFQIDRFLSNFSTQDFNTAIGCIKSFGDKAGDIW
jgi:hypothetical protein